MTSPHYTDGLVTLYHGDCIEVMRTLPDSSVHSIVTDPPYGLGFMGKAWDDLPPGLDFAVEALRVLKPGGHLLAFGGTRTWHRLAVAVEDAGFEIRDSIAWMYGSGFPKSMDVSSSIDKLDASSERRSRALTFTAWMRQHLTAQQINAATGTSMGSHYVTDREQPSVAVAELFDKLRPLLPVVPNDIEQLVADRTVESINWASRDVTGQHAGVAAAAGWRETYGQGTAAPAREKRDRGFTEEARAWEGWGTALKPAFEPIVVGRKPLAKTVAANVMAHGTGALNIDATRLEAVSTGPATTPASLDEGKRTAMGAMESAEYDGTKGRWPTNVLLDESQAAALDEQSGTLTSGTLSAHHARAPKAAGILGAFGSAEGERGYGDSGGASRFFPTFRYEAKAPSFERPEVNGLQHPTVKPLELMRWLVRLVTPPGGTVLEPFAGSGTTLEACLVEGFDVIGIEREDAYLPLILKRIKKPLQQSLFGDFGDVA